ncbi:MAG: TetR/AcrR family transcriptional regulator [Dermatophilaceae bacterium]
MPRWPEDTRERLVQAALELFGERGYARTTVDDIAARAGVSARTFFRHFPDKEEVLFAEDDRLLPVVTGAITGRKEPVGAEPLMVDVLGGLADVMEPERDLLRHRQHIIDADVALTGRELAKQARWQAAVAAALAARGFAPGTADLLAAVGFALFRRTLHTWLAEKDGPTLRERLATTLPSVRVVLDEVSAAPPR